MKELLYFVVMAVVMFPVTDFDVIYTQIFWLGAILIFFLDKIRNMCYNT